MTDSIKQIKPLGFQWETQDPFLFCVHHEDFYPKGNDDMGPNTSLDGRQIGQDFVTKDGWRMYHGTTVPGFPAHPHRGFETVTIVRKGLVDHSDSMGASGRFGNGDVQWMTAGKGVQHSEMFPLLKKDSDNPFELFQIWLNLPKAGKMVDPYFKMLWSENIPKIKTTEDEGVELAIIAGNVENTAAPENVPDSWASNPTNEVAIITMKMAPNSSWKLPKGSSDVNRSLFFFKGESIAIGAAKIDQNCTIELNADVETILINGAKESELLLLQGKPIGEPVVQHGPFVMNTNEEIQQTMYDYQRTQFGGWPWPAHENVHAREKGRFAHHADGSKEEMD